MNLIVDIGHPAHVHFYKNFMWEMEKRGHKVLITTSEKEVTKQLLDFYGFNYISLGSYGNSLISKLFNIPMMDLKMYRLVKDFKPDIFIGCGTVRGAHVSKLFRKPCVVSCDSEHAKLQNWLFRPFASRILSSYTFNDSYGNKHIKYNGFDELAYLSPKYFKPDDSLLEYLNLDKSDKFVLIRLVLWNPRDIGQSGFNFRNERDIMDFIKEIETCGYKVYISSEKELPQSLKPYRVQISPEKMLDALYFSQLYIGEGATMAAEAAVLGTPSIYVSSIPLGYLNELRDKYGLMHMCQGYKSAVDLAVPLLMDSGLKNKWRQRRECLIKENVDVTLFWVNFIETFMGSESPNLN